ncbi:DGQHR domain-containing protein [Rhizobium sp. ZW T2_16]|uniref:DGQHR domain-containing protein n=1 Tax=Rhizobium sp. ZW T2_16 TaxID=3378083 RepID=UPI00385462F6
MTKVKALRFHQWLPEWDHFEFSEESRRAKPEPFAYLFSMSAVKLRSLSGVYHRVHDDDGAEGLQRKHNPERSVEIRDFVRTGYPHSSLPKKQQTADNEKLRKPGWLPTAIVINIINAGEERRGKTLLEADEISFSNSSGNEVDLTLPIGDGETNWRPSEPNGLEPFEVIDGQHRLWAFGEDEYGNKLPDDFELPVVAFRGLDIGWQAYLFWSINVSPKKINPSHAFDLYPLLRSQDWLETFSELKVYREARAQELTDLLNQYPGSPWHKRINMLGLPRADMPAGTRVSQNSWVAALSSTYLSYGRKGATANKGLFVADVAKKGPLSWARPLQAAFLICLWDRLRYWVVNSDHGWVRQLVNPNNQGNLVKVEDTDAFTGSKTILNQDQGVRGILALSNDLFYILAHKDRSYFEIEPDYETIGSETENLHIDLAVSALKSHKIFSYIDEFAKAASSYDWQSADAPNLPDDEKLKKRAFRGSGGYVVIRSELARHLQQSASPVAQLATEWLHLNSGN